MKKHLLTSSCSGGGITKLNSNAFTLIELLAIIVILAIIAVITVPIILNIIENSRKGAATDSAYGYKDSVNKFYIAELQNHNKLKLDGTYTINSDGSLEPTEDNTFGFGDSEYGNSLDVSVSGTIPSGGKLRYSNNVLDAGCLVIGDYKVTFGTDGKIDGTVKGDCTSYELPVSKNVPTIASCPDCVFSTDTQILNASLTAQTTNDYTTLKSNSFFGFVLNNSVVESIYICGIENNKSFCVKTLDTTAYSANTLLMSQVLSGCHYEDENTEIYYCPTPTIISDYSYNQLQVRKDGEVYLGNICAYQNGDEPSVFTGDWCS